MTNKIKFIAINEFAYKVANKPYPASSNIPAWWKEMPKYCDELLNKESTLDFYNGSTNLSPKGCVPMLDAMTSGYIIPMWADVHVKSLSDTEYIPFLSWKIDGQVFQQNTDRAKLIPAINGYSNFALKFYNQWCISTPKGYSVRINAPEGHDLPFYPLPAVVDTDKKIFGLPMPVFIKQGFEGIVEAGTPIAKVTPFKRKNWKAEYGFMQDDDIKLIENSTVKKNMSGYYLKNIWTAKRYR
jgi:hypothetical protein